MYNLIIVVMAIILAVYFSIAGISYIKNDFFVKLDISNKLIVQHDNLSMAIVTYKNANNFVFPSTDKDQFKVDIKPYLFDGNEIVMDSRLPNFNWTFDKYENGVIHKYGLCLYYNNAENLSDTVVSGITSFVTKSMQAFPGMVYFGKNCGLDGVNEITQVSKDLVMENNNVNKIAVTILRN